MSEINKDGVIIGRRVKLIPDVNGGEKVIRSDMGRFILLDWLYVLDLERRLRLLEAEKGKEGETSSDVGEGD